MHKRFLITAAYTGALAVILGAFGAHALKKVLSEQALNAYETAVRYQFYHVFALALTGILYATYPGKILKSAGRLFIIGMIFFCGSLYILTFASATGINNLQWVGIITPFGGMLFISGWCTLALGIQKGK